MYSDIKKRRSFLALLFAAGDVKRYTAVGPSLPKLKPPMKNQSFTIACDMTALSPQQRQHHATLSRQLSHATAEVKELPDGYAFRYETDEQTWSAAEYVDFE